MKIGIFLGASASVGGMHQYSLSVIDALQRNAADLSDIVALYLDKDWEDVLKETDINAERLRGGSSGLIAARALNMVGINSDIIKYLTGRFNPISQQMLSHKCDYWIFPCQDEISYQLPVRAIVSIHDLMHRYERTFKEASAAWHYRAREKRFSGISKHAAMILADSEVGKRHIAESYGIDERRIVSVPYVIPPYISEVRHNHRTNDFFLPNKFFFYPAQFWSHKNHARLIEALDMVRHRFADVSLVLTGEPRHEYQRLRAQVKSRGLSANVLFAGPIPNESMATIYRKARALIMPTFFGPTNIPPLEAFACGCPVAVSDIYGMRDQTDEAALLFDPSNVSQIASTMEVLWTNDRLCEELKQKGYKRIPRFSVERMANDFKAIIGNLGVQ